MKRLFKKGEKVKVWSLQSWQGGGFLKGKKAIVHQDQRGSSVLIEVKRRNKQGKDELDKSYEVYAKQLKRR